MNFLNKLKTEYGELDGSYNNKVNTLKSKIENAYKEGKTCCTFIDTPEVIDKLMKDPTFEGFKFKESTVKPYKEGNISKLVCWD